MLLIKNGRVIDPANNIDKVMDILIDDGIIQKVEENIDCECECIDADGMWVTPGLIDLHVHLRQPGYEHKETIKTGTMAAAKGGFTSICAMPNTNPVTDNEIIVEYIKLLNDREGYVNVLPIGSVTKGQKGEELSDIGKMANAGICALSEDGKTVVNSSLMKNALKYSKMFNLPMFSHCEEITLVGKGSMNAGDRAALLGLNGISNDSEDLIIARDILLAKSTNAKLHICHLSTSDGIKLVEFGRSLGVDVTCEVTPHHFTLCDEDITDYDSNYKMNPPLRSREDVENLKNAFKNDIIDCISTDHAPHHIDEKNIEFEKAANGIVGLETSVSLTITELVNNGYLTPSKMVEKMSYNPAKILGIDKGTLGVGKIADITIINPDKEYTIDVDKFLSMGKNSPFGGRKVKGYVEYTIVNGKVILERGQIKNDD